MSHRFIEGLEARRLLSSTFVNGTLTVLGTANADNISLSISEANLGLSDNGAVKNFVLAAVKLIQVSGLGGNDTIALASNVNVRAALDGGARTVMFLGGEPTIHLPAVLEIVGALPDEATLVWKTNAHGSAQARDLLEGLFDVWLADYKFGNDGCAQRLARVANYTRIVQGNLMWANEHSELIVRHLVMPGHVDCCWAQVARWLAENLCGVKVNLRTGFWPAWQAARHAALRGTVTAPEVDRAGEIAREHGLNLVQ